MKEAAGKKVEQNKGGLVQCTQRKVTSINRNLIEIELKLFSIKQKNRVFGTNGPCSTYQITDYVACLDPRACVCLCVWALVMHLAFS